MPRPIKLFLIVSAIYVVWRLYWTFLLVIHPTPEWTAMLATLIPSDRHEMVAAAWSNAGYQAGLFILPFAVLAWLAGFDRTNWARWGVVVFLLFLEVLPLAIDGWVMVFRPELVQYMDDPVKSWLHTYRFDLTNWGTGVKIAIKATLITLLFLPASRPWFRKAGNAA